jgi:hypothetical protein
VARIVTAEQLRDDLDAELEALRGTNEVLHVSRHDRRTAVLLDPTHYVALLSRLDYLEDSVAALTTREDRAASMPWRELREPTP